MTENAHSALSPSASKRWINCPGSVALCADIPEQASSAAADEGTRAHEWCERALKGLDISQAPIAMRTHAAAYAHYCRQAIRGTIDVETRVDLSDLLGPGEKGTCDASGLTGETLHIIDFKFGFGYVDEEENTQLMIYGLGVWQNLPADVNVETFTFHIYQPRAGKGWPRHWSISTDDLMDFASRLPGYVAATKAPGAPTVAGDWCTFCRGKLKCDKLKASFEIVSTATAANWRPDMSQYLELSATFQAARNYMDAIDEAAYSAAMDGAPPPAMKLVKGKTMRSWNLADGVDAIAGELVNAGIDAMTQPELISVAVAEGLIGKKEFKELEVIYVLKKSAKPSLVPASDPREVWTPTIAGDLATVKHEAM